jgi:hypothetical protein
MAFCGRSRRVSATQLRVDAGDEVLCPVSLWYTMAMTIQPTSCSAAWRLRSLRIAWVAVPIEAIVFNRDALCRPREINAPELAVAVDDLVLQLRHRQTTVDHRETRLALHRRFRQPIGQWQKFATATMPRRPACSIAARHISARSQVPLRSAASRMASARGRRRLRATSTAVQAGDVAGRSSTMTGGAPSRRWTTRPSTGRS